ncbi:MAG: tRNA lysidine(34) synthetase TilS [Tsuneonella sp.]
MAVSGGPDSLALLLLVRAACPGQVHAATVDHGMRPESADEARAVAALCGELAVPHATLTVTLAPGNLQDRARAARYAALGAWAEQRGMGAVLTAHHADDQAETVMMRLNRGSGVSGLAGIRGLTRMRGVPVPVVRPLLAWRKWELEAIVAQAGVTPARDPSNADPRFDRARMRSALEQADWLNPPAIAASAGHLAQADEAIEWIVKQVWESEVEAAGGVLQWRQREVPELVRLRLIAEAIRRCGGAAVSLGEAARLIGVVGVAGKANLGGVLVSYARGLWTFAPEPPRG